MKSYIGIVRDHSASMGVHRHLAMADYNVIVEGIKNAANDNKLDTIVSTVMCGVGYNAEVKRDVVFSTVAKLEALADYRADGSGTPLWDSVGELIGIHELAPDINKNDVSVMIMVITDGLENRSVNWSANRLREKIKQLQGTDRWTFAFRVPHGYSSTLQRTLGVPQGNILEWEQTEIGFATASQATVNATSSYMRSLSMGVRSTQRFYADAGQVSVTALKRELVDISKGVTVWTVPGPGNSVIRDFCETMSGAPYVKGRAYYELSKTETVQDHKEIAVRKKSDGKVYAGHNARDLLGLPTYGSIRLSPGDNGGYEVFVQSTSVNRVLMPGSKILYVKPR